MARLIIYNDYLNAGSDPSHVLQSLDYIAKREGVEKNGMEERLSDMKRQLNPATASRQVTERQRVLINALLEEYPDLKEDIPYEEYKKDQNMYTASRFIAELAERLEELTMGNEIYANYIAERPGVDKDVDQEHGLFDEGGAADLQAIRSELQQHVPSLAKGMGIPITFHPPFKIFRNFIFIFFCTVAGYLKQVTVLI